MKRTPLVIAVLVMGAAAAHAEPGTPIGKVPATFTITVGAKRTGDGVRLWHVAPLVGSTMQLAVNTSSLASVMDKRRWQMRLNTTGDVDWLGMLADQLRLDGIFHFKRLFETKTAPEIFGQKHFPGYVAAVKGYFETDFRWSDGDPFHVNNIYHPFTGSLTSLIYTDHDRRCKDIAYGDRGYWSCIRRATTYAVAASANWEWNPLISESALGFVGRHYSRVNGQYAGEGGWTDFVMTPLGGMGIRVAGDIARARLWPFLDRHLSGNVWARALNVTLKIVSNPSRMVNRALNLELKGALDSPMRRPR
jgi:hypothetical protein